MSFYFTFTTLEDIKQLKLLIDFMATQDLDYPHYRDYWIPKVESQLEREEKQAILAFSDGKLVLDIVHQVCRDSGLGMLREIKNFRVHPYMRNRYFGKFGLRQLYKVCEGKYDGLICDVRANQEETLNYFIQEGFIPIMNLPLYEKNMDEIVMFKSLRKDSELLKPRIKKIIRARSF